MSDNKKTSVLRIYTSRSAVESVADTLLGSGFTALLSPGCLFLRQHRVLRIRDNHVLTQGKCHVTGRHGSGVRRNRRSDARSSRRGGPRCCRSRPRPADKSALRHKWVEQNERTIHRFDVRTPEEYEAGHLPGFRNTPGGQLVQETDYDPPVRGARIILADDDGARANMTASWLAQMNWDAFVVDGLSTKDFKEHGPWQAPVPPFSCDFSAKHCFTATAQRMVG